MPIDNFDAIRGLMHFELDGDIYFLEVLRRGKDVGEHGEYLIRDYHIHSFEQYDKLRPEIIALCDTYQARAYIRLNQRNVEDANIWAQIEMLKEQLTRNQTIRKAIRTGNTNTILHAKMNKIRSATKIYGSVLTTRRGTAPPHALSGKTRTFHTQLNRGLRPLNNSRGKRSSIPQTSRGLTLLSQICRDPAIGVRKGENP